MNVTVEKDMEGRNDKMVVDSDEVNEVNEVIVINIDENESEGVGNDDEIKPPSIGMVFNTPDEVRSYYDKYACHLGFNSIKKSTKSGDDGNVKYFTLACSRSGPDGRVYVCRVILEHNHELVPGLHGMKKKKSRAPRAKKVGTGQNHVPHSVAHEAGSSANLKSDYAIPRIVTNPNQIIFGSSHLLSKRSVNRNVSSGSKRRYSVFANPVLNQESTERILARKAVEFVKSGMVIGLGSGTTISMVMEELGRLIREGKLKDIIAVGGNYQSRVLARQFGVTIVDLSGVSKIDIAFDGVDEVDFNKNLLKCGGPAHTVQKVIDSVASQCIILVDQPKVVHRLGSAFPVPVEVLPPALTPVLKRLANLGGVPEIRFTSNDNGPLFTDLGNMVVDVSFPNGIQNPAELEKNIKLLPGVVENGKNTLFVSCIAFEHIYLLHAQLYKHELMLNLSFSLAWHLQILTTSELAGIVTGVATTVLVAVKERGAVNVMSLEDYVRTVLDRRDATLTS
ncbi:RIBOSE-5-PHOSPHATE ISOMERASE [Salix viminalis]|uniref:ribose-5-phosphate isomerase n=1 Tax=Salix viminalis TaxID=40686 RepID=A0A9Q0ZP34_SALVM|nr:RIBOSE-5-PHOSPHATE ISOMERASE [Salix viminalis]